MASSVEFKNLKLSECFDQGLTSYENICESTEPSKESEVQYKIIKCMKMLEYATQLVSAAELYSNNETIEEVPTSDIKYMLLPFMLGSLALKLTNNGNRLNVVKTAEVYFRDYLQRCKDYGLTDVTLPSPYNETDETTTQFSMDFTLMARRRAEKIKNYKEQKLMESQLQLLKEQNKCENVEEECKRSYIISLLKFNVSKALEEIDSLQAEMRILHYKLKNEDNLDQIKGSKIKSKPLTPIIITKNELQKKVFGAGYPSLPTMTVEEFCQQRINDGVWHLPTAENTKCLQQLDEAPKKHESDNEDQLNEEVEENERQRLNARDEYKDDHRRGWGNRYNRS
ncbi:immunoglobulin-binding protein 1 [Daktulosphaira vitifoliae]|uniref:immunoglobulin-binding protein 1 n=1 Tax=Daktulosphaira vitifoliae TaxID=58002 RepID=UPI0021AB05C6|nr:immunoglobulin-binding protein 1 [Daktulosphaira vitifoliae]